MKIDFSEVSASALIFGIFGYAYASFEYCFRGEFRRCFESSLIEEPNKFFMYILIGCAIGIIVGIIVQVIIESIE